VRWLTSVILATWEEEIRRIPSVGGQPSQIFLETPISKITSAKWTRGMAKTGEGLLCTCEALSLTPVPQKKLYICIYIYIFMYICVYIEKESHHWMQILSLHLQNYEPK
jgi:hypothetical protein